MALTEEAFMKLQDAQMAKIQVMMKTTVAENNKEMCAAITDTITEKMDAKMDEAISNLRKEFTGLLDKVNNRVDLLQPIPVSDEEGDTNMPDAKAGNSMDVDDKSKKRRWDDSVQWPKPGAAASSGAAAPVTPQVSPVLKDKPVDPANALQHSIMVAGFGRPLLEGPRKEHWERIAKLLPDQALYNATPKFPHKDKKYYIVFPNDMLVHKALDVLNADVTRLYWNDDTFSIERKVYAKRHKEVENRDLNRFRREFYVALERFFSVRPEFSNKVIKLNTVRGTMMAEMDGEVYSMFSFPREFTKGTTVVTVDEVTAHHLDIKTAELEAVIQEAKDKYEAI